MDDEYNKVISFESEKVWISKINDTKCFVKRTNVKETENLKIAKDLLHGKFIQVDEKKYLLNSPDILKYEEENNTVFLETCYGRNLELMLRSETSRDKAVKLLNAIMTFCLETSFRWKDFAPRNILISDDTNIKRIWL